MKFNSLSVGIIFLIAGILGCSTMGSEKFISKRSLHKFSRQSKYDLRKVTITDSQQKKIAQLLDNQIPVEEVVRYYKARKRRARGILGDVFVISGESVYGPYRILVLIQQLSVSRLIQDKPIFKQGHPVINREFLSQFVGRSLGQSFEIARTPEDILYTPTKIKPIADEMELSRQIALRIKKALAEAATLRGEL